MTLEEFNGQLWPLLRQINDSINALLRPVCDRQGLTPIQLRALLAIRQQPCTVGELGRSICMADTNVSALCKRLERRGLLRRVRGSRDERVVHLELTGAGLLLAQELDGQIAQRLRPVWEARRRDLPRILQDLDSLSGQLQAAVSLAAGSPLPQEKEQTP